MSQATTWGTDPHFFGPRHAFREALMARVLLARLGPGARVLDVGCGAGSFLSRLEAAGCRATGLDAAPGFVAHVAAAGAEVLEGDAQALPFESGSFEAVVAGEVLEHLEDDGAAVREAWRVLAPGGWYVLTVPADPAAWDASDEWAGHRRRYTREGLEGLLRGAGFEVVRLERWGFPLVGLYHRWVYLPMLARKREGPSAPLGGWKRWVAAAVLAAFQVDRCFVGSPWGLGWIAVARRGGPSPGSKRLDGA